MSFRSPYIKSIIKRVTNSNSTLFSQSRNGQLKVICRTSRTVRAQHFSAKPIPLLSWLRRNSIPRGQTRHSTVSRQTITRGQPISSSSMTATLRHSTCSTASTRGIGVQSESLLAVIPGLALLIIFAYHHIPYKYSKAQTRSIMRLKRSLSGKLARIDLPFSA